MNKRQALDKGYGFHGAYSNDKEEIKARALELRKLGNKAVTVNVPADKLSRGSHSTGYAVYWIESSANIAIREAAHPERKINQLPNEKESVGIHTILNEVAGRPADSVPPIHVHPFNLKIKIAAFKDLYDRDPIIMATGSFVDYEGVTCFAGAAGVLVTKVYTKYFDYEVDGATLDDGVINNVIEGFTLS